MQSQTLDLKGFMDDCQTESKPQTRPSTTFRSTGRDKSAHWSNRFTKDVHDLQYDVKYTLIKGKDQLNRNNVYQNHLRQSRRTRSSRMSQGKISVSSADKYKNRVEMMKSKKMYNPEKINLAGRDKYSGVNTRGLSKFQFERTIQGKIIYKSSKNLGFKNQTERSTNLNPVWYKSKKDIDISKMLKKSFVHESHPFQSYTKRKVFEPKQQLDKFYDTQKSLRLTSARTIKQTCKIDGVVGRHYEMPPKSESLSYNQFEARRKIMQKICIYPLSQIPRSLKFTRQVISPERGCYR